MAMMYSKYMAIKTSLVLFQERKFICYIRISNDHNRVTVNKIILCAYTLNIKSWSSRASSFEDVLLTHYVLLENADDIFGWSMSGESRNIVCFPHSTTAHQVIQCRDVIFDVRLSAGSLLASTSSRGRWKGWDFPSGTDLSKYYATTTSLSISNWAFKCGRIRNTAEKSE